VCNSVGIMYSDPKGMLIPICVNSVFIWCNTVVCGYCFVLGPDALVYWCGYVTPRE
jgi:hypothetical protein